MQNKYRPFPVSLGFSSAAPTQPLPTGKLTRRRFPSLFKLGLTTAIATFIVGTEAIVNTVVAVTVPQWTLNPNNGTVQVQLPEGVRPRLAVIQQPSRIIIDLPDTDLGVNVTELYESGLVRRVSVSQLEPTVARMTVDFAPGFILDDREIDLRRVGVENQWVLRPVLLARRQPPAENNLTTTTAAPTTPISQSPTSANISPQFTSQPRPISALPNPQPETFPDVEFLRVPLNRPTQTNLVRPDTFSQPVGTQILPMSTTTAAIPYGQPLPTELPPPSQSFRPLPLPETQRPDRRILLPVGTTITLQYPGIDDVRLKSQFNRQDVLLLQGGIVDAAGNFVVPPDTPVVGRFETTNQGTRFVAQAINLEGRSIPFVAESTWIPGARPIKPENVAIGSGIGGLGGFLISGFDGLGFLAGAAVGGAVGAISSPQQHILEPGQVVQVRLVQELAQNDFLLGITPALPTSPRF
ncbi:hypothetical protein NIES46_32490 [Arthrospira platensis NIES-46]|jgi:hypothetical protein|uniref:AMIN domain-containing protein n=1 Tax=Limnospira platensis NIES-46 TaxID=1236695 RepID=A0A5M3T8I5_LIMPL|nr:AMIN domain-containing protein [Arthrospira platensis]GCE95187.1 hypothetical protein NIES46_32490 [Arthrospira platensis NIES-46]